jgi:hypothetical protein
MPLTRPFRPQLLESFSTTLEEDEALLAADKFPSNYMRMSVLFRAEKKRTIKAAIDDLVALGR